jgi:hypothetical protein
MVLRGKVVEGTEKEEPLLCGDEVVELVCWCCAAIAVLNGITSIATTNTLDIGSKNPILIGVTSFYTLIRVILSIRRT